jgi:hypothetical protein
MKQTAVEWISLSYNYVLWLRNTDEISAEQADKMRAQYLAEAKEMEKEQIKDAYWNGGVNWDEGIDALTYYNETYGDK